MGSTFYSLHYHVVFSTKDRQPFIRTEWRARMHAYLGGQVRNMDGIAEIVGGVDDHVHLLLSLTPSHCIADLVREMKKEATKWAKSNFEHRFSWQEGYAVFSVSPTATDAVRGYIEHQELHHHKLSFEDELRELLDRAGIAYEEKYLL